MDTNTSASRNSTEQIQMTAKPRGVRENAAIRASRDARDVRRVLAPRELARKDLNAARRQPAERALVTLVDAREERIAHFNFPVAPR